MCFPEPKISQRHCCLSGSQRGSAFKAQRVLPVITMVPYDQEWTSSPHVNKRGMPRQWEAMNVRLRELEARRTDSLYGPLSIALLEQKEQSPAKKLNENVWQHPVITTWKSISCEGPLSGTCKQSMKCRMLQRSRPGHAPTLLWAALGESRIFK